mmetsp:Transcript_49403/g.141357  ORF Transcript_49403/g.141357 Transcript_49403/m.141357 type:complete len:256 (+) Transcript_49403:2-769(+)
MGEAPRSAPRLSQLPLVSGQALQLVGHLLPQVPDPRLQLHGQPGLCGASAWGVWPSLQPPDGLLAASHAPQHLRQLVGHVSARALALPEGFVVAPQLLKTHVESLDRLLQLLLHRCNLLLVSLNALQHVRDSVCQVAPQELRVRKVLLVPPELVHAQLQGSHGLLGAVQAGGRASGGQGRLALVPGASRASALRAELLQLPLRGPRGLRRRGDLLREAAQVLLESRHGPPVRVCRLPVAPGQHRPCCKAPLRHGC